MTSFGKDERHNDKSRHELKACRRRPATTWSLQADGDHIRIRDNAIYASQSVDRVPRQIMAKRRRGKKIKIRKLYRKLYRKLNEIHWPIIPVWVAALCHNIPFVCFNFQTNTICNIDFTQWRNVAGGGGGHGDGSAARSRTWSSAVRHTHKRKHTKPTGQQQQQQTRSETHDRIDYRETATRRIEENKNWQKLAFKTIKLNCTSC